MTRMVTVSGHTAPSDDDGTFVARAVPDPAPPAFGTAMWGYRRSEVDAWASWVDKLLTHSRMEKVRADSAEATLRATLDRLEQLELERPAATEQPGEPAPGERAGRSDQPGPDGPPEPVDRRARTADRPVPDLPRRTPGVSGVPRPAATRQGGEPDRLRVVESTLQDVMSLLHHLVDREDGRPAD